MYRFFIINLYVNQSIKLINSGEIQSISLSFHHRLSFSPWGHFYLSYQPIIITIIEIDQQLIKYENQIIFSSLWH